MRVDKHHVPQQLCSVSVDFQQFEGSISSIKEDLTESFHLERRRILVIWNSKGAVIVSCVPNTRFDHIVILLSVKGSESSVAQNMSSFINLPLLCTLVEIMVYFRTH